MHTMRKAALRTGARTMSSFVQKGAFQDQVRQKLELRTRTTRKIGSIAVAPHRVWDDFLSSTPAPSINAMRNRAAELFGSVDPVIEILQQEEMDAHVPEGETPEDSKLIRLGIAAAYNCRGSNWYHDKF